MDQRDILYSLCQQKKLINNIGQIKTSPENVRNCAMAIKVSAVLFLRRTFDLIVTFIRPDPNARIGPSFLIQILKFGREARYCPSRGLVPQRPTTGSLAEYVKAVFASLCLLYWVF